MLDHFFFRTFLLLAIIICPASWGRMTEISREILSLSCDEKVLINSILQGKLKAPKVLYHYGKKKILARNIPQRNIPVDDWNKFIMGDETIWRLKKTRQGLYGSSGLDTNFFLDETFIEITIKDECRHPQHIGELTTLPDNLKFISWLKVKEPGLNFSQRCHLTSGGYEDDICEKWVNLYLQEQDVRIIYDNWVSKSFYIRDRNCIENIRGADRAREIIDIFTDVPALWVPRCQSESTEYLISYLLNALMHLKTPLTSTELNKLRMSTSHAGANTSEVVDAFIRCHSKFPEKITEYFRLDENTRRYFVIKSMKYQEICL